MTRDEEIAALRERIEQLERVNKPPPPPDMKDWQPINPIDRVGMPPEVLREMAQAIPTGMVRDIVSKGTVRGPSGQGPPQQLTNARGRAVSGTGWVDAPPLRNPPGVNWADRLMDEQDRRDRAELAQRLGKR